MTSYKTKKIVNKIIDYFICIVIVAVILFPFIWMLPATMKDKKEIFAIPNTFFPKNPTFGNFKTIFTIPFNGFNFLRSMGYTLLTSSVAVVLNFSFNMTAAYAFARIDFRGKRFFWPLCLSTMFVPGITILMTSIRLMHLMHLVNTLWVVLLPGIANGYMIFFFRQFFLSIPSSLEEAAILDGCSRLKVYLYIFIPMSSAPMVIQGMGCFMANWNSFMWPSLTITSNTEIAQVMQVVKTLSAYYKNNYSVVITAVFIAALVPISLFSVFQKKIIGGIAISGLK
ncbi:MAG: carbohydrate ABC transporter permease [Clostridia bacterium]|nr:carbohydrate ABC transporter permease [Clostridia bacterium]